MFVSRTAIGAAAPMGMVAGMAFGMAAEAHIDHEPLSENRALTECGANHGFEPRETRGDVRIEMLEWKLKLAVEAIRSGGLENEALVSQAVVLPVLDALGWDYADPAEIYPQYKAGGGWVDYALLNDGEPLAFIEAKRIGGIDPDGERQLFEYAKDSGVFLLILTDGEKWNFYLNGAADVPSAQMFYRVDLRIEGCIAAYADFLAKHVHRENAVSGLAKTSAEEMLWRDMLLSCWQALLERPNRTLLDLLVETVEERRGAKPDLPDAADFLRALAAKPSVAPALGDCAPETGGRIVGFTFRETAIAGSAIGTLAEILQLFGRRDPEFMQLFSDETKGRTRRLVAMNRYDLWPGRPSLAEKYSRYLENGWWLRTDLGIPKIRGHIETACEIAGVRFGSQLTLIERQD